MAGRIVSLNVGQPQPLAFRGGMVLTGSFKRPVAGPVRLGPTRPRGDVQADLRVHGGPDKAVCVYPTEHLPLWSERLGRRLEPGAFGENLQTSSTSWVMTRASATSTASAARWCKSRSRGSRATSSRRATASRRSHCGCRSLGRTGFYFRCLELVRRQVGDTIALVERPAPDGHGARGQPRAAP